MSIAHGKPICTKPQRRASGGIWYVSGVSRRNETSPDGPGVPFWEVGGSIGDCRRAASLYAGHVQQLGGANPLPNLMEVKG
jgi:hypothetical protein